MKLLDSLLDAIVRLEGDALVMHVGEKPYVITASASMSAYRGPLAWGQVELSSRVLTFDAVSSMLAQILPADQQRALDEFGAIEHEVLPPDGILDRFTVVAARGGEDVWVEVRRKPVPAPVAAAPVSEPGPEAEPKPVAPPAAAPEPVPTAATDPVPPPDTVLPEPDVEPAVESVTNPIPDPIAEADATITVAFPGEGTESVSLDAVHESAIQIVDEEPQGVPTEEEVDAMMAATASVLLTSVLTVDHINEEVAHEPEAETSGIEQTVDLSALEPPAAFELSPHPRLHRTRWSESPRPPSRHPRRPPARRFLPPTRQSPATLPWSQPSLKNKAGRQSLKKRAGRPSLKKLKNSLKSTFFRLKSTFFRLWSAIPSTSPSKRSRSHRVKKSCGRGSTRVRLSRLLSTP